MKQVLENSSFHHLLSQPLITFTGVCFRMHNPVWAWSPLSMEGERRVGGRFNPKGCDALYLSLKPETSIAEVAGGASSKLLDPMLLCSYQADLDGILDLRLCYQQFQTPWRIELLNKKIPPGWQLYRLIEKRKGIKGMLVPSYQITGEYNLILFHWHKSQLKLHDPDGRLRSVYGDRLSV
ncbi:RES family NAD+ phosphorylase [Vibrio mediterranei]|uniref:RES family NAD+ phosphorylase n=1 Tax=Vibrio mediterranei TaxID=689 RepID=UPI004068895A